MEKQQKKIIGLSETELILKGEAITTRLGTEIERRLMHGGSEYEYPRLSIVQNSDWERKPGGRVDLCLTEEELRIICAKLEKVREYYRRRIGEILEDPEKSGEVIAAMETEVAKESQKMLEERIFIPAGVDQKVTMAKLMQNIFSPEADDTSRMLLIEWCKNNVMEQTFFDAADYRHNTFSPAELHAFAPAADSILNLLDKYFEQCDISKSLSAPELVKGMVSYLKFEISYRGLVKKAGADPRWAKKILENLRKLDPAALAHTFEDETVQILTEHRSPLREICTQMQSTGMPSVAETGSAHAEKNYYIHFLLAALEQCGEIDAVRSADNFKKFMALVEEILSVMPYLSISDSEDEREAEIRIKIHKIYSYLAEKVQKEFGLKRLSGVKIESLQIRCKIQSLESIAQTYFNYAASGEEEKKQVINFCCELFEKYPEGDFSDLTVYEEFNEFIRSMDRDKFGGLQVINKGLMEQRAKYCLKLIANYTSPDNIHWLAGHLLGIPAHESDKNDRLSGIKVAVWAGAMDLIAGSMEIRKKKNKMAGSAGGNDILKLIAVADSLHGDPRDENFSAGLRRAFEKIRELKEEIIALNGRLAEIFSAPPKDGEKAEIRRLIAAETQAAGLLQTLIKDCWAVHREEIQNLLLEGEKEWRDRRNVMERADNMFKELMTDLEKIQSTYSNYLDET